jgi:hypothetical protein
LCRRDRLNCVCERVEKLFFHPANGFVRGEKAFVRRKFRSFVRKTLAFIIQIASDITKIV